VQEDHFALMFDAYGIPLRIAVFSDCKPQPFTVLGWQVDDVLAIVRDLQKAGVLLERFDGPGQDEYGLWHAPDGS
jgi:hypothetical protein